eukprot:5253052-Pyramimonas_sp.AAC.1
MSALPPPGNIRRVLPERVAPARPRSMTFARVRPQRPPRNGPALAPPGLVRGYCPMALPPPGRIRG